MSKPKRPIATQAPEDSLLPSFAGAQQFDLEVVQGPLLGGRYRSSDLRTGLGSHAANAFVLADPTVSRFHCELALEERGLRVRDLGSSNGTLLDGVQVMDAYARSGSKLRLGNTVIQARIGSERGQLLLSEETAFGGLAGTSAAMRGVFWLLERAGRSDRTLLLEGETGTGKGAAALALHESGPRASGPFVVVDCSSVVSNLLEDDLFGHEAGAFTGATDSRAGAFERAQGGTVFLDEVGELPLELQPKLLRVLEARQIRRVGGTQDVEIDVRVIAATNRELRGMVNAGTFRADLYFRLAVLRVVLPPLRERLEDLPTLVESLLADLAQAFPRANALATPEFVQRLRRSVWPGNVRELRNYLERCLVLEQPLLPEALTARPMPAVDPRVPLAHARGQLIADFERKYVEAILDAHDGNVSSAARAAGVDRGWIYQLMRRHGLKAK